MRTLLLALGTTIIAAGLTVGALALYTGEWGAAFACLASALAVTVGVTMIAKEPA